MKQLPLTVIVADKSNPSATPLAGASVTLYSGDRAVAQTKTDARGVCRFFVNPGKYTVRATQKGYYPGSKSVTQTAGGGLAGLEMRKIEGPF